MSDQTKPARLSHAMHFRAAQAMAAVREQAEREKWELQQIADWLTNTCGFPVTIGGARPVLKTIGMAVPRAHAKPEVEEADPLAALGEKVRTLARATTQHVEEHHNVLVDRHNALGKQLHEFEVAAVADIKWLREHLLQLRTDFDAFKALFEVKKAG